MYKLTIIYKNLMQGADKLHLQLIKAHFYFRLVHEFHKFIFKNFYIKGRVHKFQKLFYLYQKKGA